MSLLTVLLQVAAKVPTDSTTTAVVVSNENYFQLLMKGGWILVPLFILFFLSIYMFIERWITIKNLGQGDSVWFARISELIADNKVHKLIK